MGFILGPMLEEHLRRAMIISKGDATVFVTRPLSLALLLLAVGVLVVVFLPAIARKRAQVFVEED
jgi:TctA family transporter